MLALRPDRLTGVLAGACVVLGLIAWAPRHLPRPGAIHIERPDVVVSVEGQVARPGAYTLPFGARVADLIDAAGGFQPAAARSLVALADPLTDGEVVQVPALTAASGVERVSLNAASAEALEALPGIGPAIAARIVAHRPFARVDDLMLVPGIGPRTLERLRPLVAL